MKIYNLTTEIIPIEQQYYLVIVAAGTNNYIASANVFYKPNVGYLVIKGKRKQVK